MMKSLSRENIRAWFKDKQYRKFTEPIVDVLRKPFVAAGILTLALTAGIYAGYVIYGSYKPHEEVAVSQLPHGLHRLQKEVFCLQPDRVTVVFVTKHNDAEQRNLAGDQIREVAVGKETTKGKTYALRLSVDEIEGTHITSITEVGSLEDLRAPATVAIESLPAGTQQKAFKPEDVRSTGEFEVWFMEKTPATLPNEIERGYGIARGTTRLLKICNNSGQ